MTKVSKTNCHGACKDALDILNTTTFMRAPIRRKSLPQNHAMFECFECLPLSIIFIRVREIINFPYCHIQKIEDLVSTCMCDCAIFDRYIENRDLLSIYCAHNVMNNIVRTEVH